MARSTADKYVRSCATLFRQSRDELLHALPIAGVYPQLTQDIAPGPHPLSLVRLSFCIAFHVVQNSIVTCHGQ